MAEKRGRPEEEQDRGTKSEHGIEKDDAGIGARGTKAEHGIERDTTPSSSAAEGGAQNREKKISQYEDGVSEIGSLIGDLAAFDDLVDAIDDDRPTSGPLARQKQTNHHETADITDITRAPMELDGADDWDEPAGRLDEADSDDEDEDDEED